MAISIEAMPQEEIRTASLETIRAAGHAYGADYAGWNRSEAPEVGQPAPGESSSLASEDVIETAEEAHRVFVSQLLANESESARQFSPAEFWISAMNSRADADEAWEALEDGIRQGVEQVAQELDEQWQEQEQEQADQDEEDHPTPGA